MSIWCVLGSLGVVFFVLGWVYHVVSRSEPPVPLIPAPFDPVLGPSEASGVLLFVRGVRYWLNDDRAIERSPLAVRPYLIEKAKRPLRSLGASSSETVVILYERAGSHGSSIYPEALL